VRFSILGDGPLKEHLIQKAKDLKLNGCIEFLPSAPDPMPYYKSLDLYLNTSHHEGIPLSILEAMACRIPVIAPRVGGIPEILSNSEIGILIDNREPHNFATACISILENGNMRNSIANNNLKRIQNVFSNSKMADYYYEIYNNH
ncbi:MAG: glycosyltransferase family 4 protein, partial [Thermodesulfovibrionales bacterium]